MIASITHQSLIFYEYIHISWLLKICHLIFKMNFLPPFLFFFFPSFLPLILFFFLPSFFPSSLPSSFPFAYLTCYYVGQISKFSGFHKSCAWSTLLLIVSKASQHLPAAPSMCAVGEEAGIPFLTWIPVRGVRWMPASLGWLVGERKPTHTSQS